jgi:phosphoserine phosphatase RsbU/P
MSTTPFNFRNYRVTRLALVGLLALAAPVSLRAVWDRMDEMLHGQNYVSPSFSLETPTFRVGGVEPAAERAGLRKGDFVVGANGHPAQGWTDIYGPLHRARTGDRMLLHVNRTTAKGLVDQEVSVPLERFTYVGYLPGSAGYIATICSRILTPLFCLALGFWVAGVRTNDRAAWALLVLMLSVANLITDGRTTYGHEDALQAFLTGLTSLFIRLGPLALVYFAIIFPDTLAFDRKFPWMKWMVLGPMLARAILYASATGLMSHHRDLVGRFWPVILATDAAGTYVELALVALFFVILGYKSVTASTSDARRRFLLLDTGAAAGLLPFLVTYTWLVMHDGRFRGWPALVSIAFLFVFPLTMAYVIVVHRAMDVRVALRQGLQYLLATSGVRVLQIAMSAGVIVLAVATGANTSLAARVGLVAAGFAMLVGLGAFASRLHRWIDRRFFREAYEADRILGDLAEKVRTMVETGPLLETVATVWPRHCMCRGSRFCCMGMACFGRHVPWVTAHPRLRAWPSRV